jgi:hypothetical protein
LGVLLGGITGVIPALISGPIRVSASKALSAITALRVRLRQQGRGRLEVVGLAWRDGERDRVAERVDEGVDLGRQPPRERPSAWS